MSSARTHGNVLVVVIWLSLSPVFAVLNYLWLAITDTWIASLLGGFQTMPAGDYGAWTQIGAISWTFSSLLGPAITLGPAFGVALAGYTGVSSALFLCRIFSRHPRPQLLRDWLAVSFLLLWVIRIPVPLEWSLFYWVAVRY
jgi:hypothetical protein